MNTPTEFLEGIHAALESLPDDLAATLNSGQQPDIPDFVLPAGADMAPADLARPLEAVRDEIEDYPDFGTVTAAPEDFPSLPSVNLSEADYPSPTSASFSDVGEFPDMPGFSQSASTMPSPQGEEYDLTSQMVGHLEDISRGITNLSRGGGSLGTAGFQRSTGPQQVEGRQVYIRDKDDQNGIPNKTILSHRFENGN